MKLTRRSLLAGTVGGPAVAACRSDAVGKAMAPDSAEGDRIAGKIARAAAEPVLPRDLFREPVVVESMEKGLSKIPFECDTSPLTCVDGIMRVPSGPGFGIDLDPDWVKKAEVVTSAI